MNPLLKIVPKQKQSFLLFDKIYSVQLQKLRVYLKLFTSCVSSECEEKNPNPTISHLFREIAFERF